MAFYQQLIDSFFSRKRESLATSDLLAHDEMGKQEAQDAVDVLVKYKSKVHDFTDEIVAFWPLPQKVMTRYHINDVDQLNEWLDDFS